MTTGWQNSDRHQELPPGWARIRRRIFRRDGYRCMWMEDGGQCTAVATEVDHIGDPLDHAPENLRSLCTPHHRKHTAAQSLLARNLHLRHRPRTQHPGMAG